MKEKTLELLKTSDILVPSILFNNYRKINITDEELILLIYFINYSQSFDVKSIADFFDKKTSDVLKLINNLVEKGLISIETVKENKTITEYINLDNLYQKLLFQFMNNDLVKEKTDIYSIFEKEFGRTLSPIEYELVNGWLENDMTEEMIELALKEAVYNGVSSLRYIDKILFNWNKKGLKTKVAIEKEKKEFTKNNKETKKELFDYDWLNDE